MRIFKNCFATGRINSINVCKTFIWVFDMLKAHLLADPKESANFISFFQSEYRGEYRGDSTHYNTESGCRFCVGDFDFKYPLCTLSSNKQLN